MTRADIARAPGLTDNDPMPPSVSPDEPTDAALLARIGDGDAMAVRLLVDRYDRLVRYTIFRASRQQCASDPLWLDSVASETWTSVCRTASREASRAVENLPSFLMQIARRRCIDALRRVPLSGADLQEQEDQVAAADEDAATVMARLEQLSALRDAIGGLDEDDQVLCGELPAITEGHWREAAGRLGIPESTLRSRWKRIVERLRTAIGRSEGDAD